MDTGKERETMKKTLAFILSFAMLLTLCACGEKKPEQSLSAAGYISYLKEGLTSANLPVDDLTGSEPKESSSLELGAYIYTSYIVTDGVYVAVYESPDQSELLKLAVTVDLSLAKGDKLSTGSFALFSLLSYFDAKAADDLGEQLGMNNPQQYSVAEADGQNGSYEFGYTRNDLVLNYTPNLSEDK